MQRIKSCIITVAIILTMVVGALAQKQKSKPQKTVRPLKKIESAHTSAITDQSANEKKVRDIITFLEFVLNTLGNSTTSARDKDVLITESYSKIFRDSKVQVEDDLDEERGVITNKDVVAYLKDINFFFKDIKFEFTIEKIEQGVNADNQIFYKALLHRNLSGTTSDGKTVNNTIPRYIEINLNPKDQDLKIASIYTNEFNEKEALRNWWSQLSYEWKELFKKRFNLLDTVTPGDIRKITSLEELDLSNNRYIQSFEPLSQLKNLKVLNLSGTSVNDLTPIRNLTDLVDLNLSRTAIRDISPLKYSSNLVKLNISNTQVEDIGVIRRTAKLQSLDLSATIVNDFGPLGGLSALTSLTLNTTKLSDLVPVEKLTLLTELNISRTSVQDLTPLKGMKNLKRLACDSTPIKNVSALGSLESLKILQANYTLISDLQPLHNLTQLEKVYCDQSPINKGAADAFMSANPSVLVVFDSRDLKSWWDGLSPDWQQVISKIEKISANPSKEELARVGNADSINISGHTHITDLEPLRKFQKLKVVIASRTSISDLSSIQDHREIKYLDISETRVMSLTSLARWTNLRVLKADKCKIENIDVLTKIKGLEKVYVDEAGLNDIIAQEFLQENPKCLLIYKTIHLNRWWRNLSESWKEALKTKVKDTTRESFHYLVEQEAFHLKDVPVGDLSGLAEFIRLKELHFSGTSITDIVVAENLRSLKSLHVSNGPVRIAETISQLTELEDLDISNTPIEDLTVIWKLQNLKTLNCAGTQIKRLDAVEKLEKLEFLDCSNTNVGKLNALDYLHLKTLKCYNTRVSNRAIENFKASHPECKVIYYR